MNLSIERFPQQTIEDRVARGEMTQYSSDKNPSSDHCGDKDFLMPEFTETTPPMRYFGSPFGLASTALAAYGMQHDVSRPRIKSFLAGFDNGIVGFAASIANSAYRSSDKIRIPLHSSDLAEEGHKSISPSLESDVDCKLMIYIGQVLHNTSENGSVATSQMVARYNEKPIKSEINLAAGSFVELGNILGGKSATVTRRDVATVMGSPDQVIPQSLVKRGAKPDESTAGIIDFAGYGIQPDGINYVHSAKVPEIILPDLLPELDLKDESLRGSAVVLGMGTLKTLGVNRALVIPESRTATL